MGVVHALGWSLPVEDFWSSPFFNGISSRDSKHEYMYQTLESYKADDINQLIDPNDIPVWLDRNSTTMLSLILRADRKETLNSLIEFVGPSPDDTTHVFIWASWYGKSKTYRARCDIDHALYGDADFIIRENNPSTTLYGKNYMDGNGIAHSSYILSDQHLSLMEWNQGLLNIRLGVPMMFRAWNNHVGLLDLSRIAKMKYMAARYWR